MSDSAWAALVAAAQAAAQDADVKRASVAPTKPPAGPVLLPPGSSASAAPSATVVVLPGEVSDNTGAVAAGLVIGLLGAAAAAFGGWKLWQKRQLATLAKEVAAKSDRRIFVAPGSSGGSAAPAPRQTAGLAVRAAAGGAAGLSGSKAGLSVAAAPAATTLTSTGTTTTFTFGGGGGSAVPVAPSPLLAAAAPTAAAAAAAPSSATVLAAGGMLANPLAAKARGGGGGGNTGLGLHTALGGGGAASAPPALAAASSSGELQTRTVPVRGGGGSGLLGEASAGAAGVALASANPLHAGAAKTPAPSGDAPLETRKLPATRSFAAGPAAAKAVPERAAFTPTGMVSEDDDRVFAAAPTVSSTSARRLAGLVASKRTAAGVAGSGPSPAAAASLAFFKGKPTGGTAALR